MQTIRSKIFTTISLPPVDSAATGAAAAKSRCRGRGGIERGRGRGVCVCGGRKVAELQTRGMAATRPRKPINLYVCLVSPRTISNLLRRHLRAAAPPHPRVLSPPSPSLLPFLQPLPPNTVGKYISLFLSRSLDLAAETFICHSPSSSFIVVLLTRPLCAPPSSSSRDFIA